ncbi:hypothetical protein Val02_75880 [Virgisporangium aliadipatigenens]|uniref:Uncharacterized protein n=1 Tax=Virgisporangium aliadipatigenens TaxID=741659 RepID=A0A8J3YU50_9ACTN|nr:hypothetical protein [Virgisporangium aliadipatigenens]GIJ50702.1 hypothetical protein Val02_75880 [Virgisporangium aliadipatigenens]
MTQADDQFVVRIDRPALRRLTTRTAAVAVLLHSIVVAVVGGTAAVMVLTGAGSTVLKAAVGAGIALFAYAVGAIHVGLGTLSLLRLRQGMDRLLSAGLDGLWMAVPQSDAGSVFLPWTAVGVVSATDLWLRVRIQAGTMKFHPGSVGLDDPKIWRALNGNGLLVDMRDANAESDDILNAVSYYRKAAMPESSI